MKKVMIGNHAVSWGVQRARVEVISAYPITPQTQIVEELSDMCADGRLPARYIKVESEHSAMAACIGASATGVRTFTASASLNDWMVVSNTSWFVSQYSWIQPVSRCDSVSFWSVQMFQPGAIARFTSAITIGRRPPAAQCSSSCIRASPCAEVAVNVRTPVAEAPMHAAIALCSDSTLM